LFLSLTCSRGCNLSRFAVHFFFIPPCINCENLIFLLQDVKCQGCFSM
jgi:hypothetical protein